MQAYETKPTDLSRPAYYCYRCGKAFLGRPQEKPMPGYFGEDEDGESVWFEDESKYTIVFVCHDDPPCIEETADAFYGKTIQDVLQVTKTVIDPQTNRLETISRGGSWSCGNCETHFNVLDFGATRAKQRAVRCCE